MAKGKTKRHASALKAHRQSLARKIQNYQVRSRVRTLTTNVMKAITEKNMDQATEAFRLAQAAWQKAAQRGIFSKNAASRKISTLASRLSALKKPAPATLTT